jgi:hypothetical protein
MPGKRESRRVVGNYVLREQDLMEHRRFEDAVAFGGWSIDRHPPGGFLDFEEPPSVHVYTPGLYQIPLRSLFSRDVPNLFLAGRDISASHVAICSTRVQLTCMSIGEAVGVAAAACTRDSLRPAELASSPERVRALQTTLLRDGTYIPFVDVDVDRPPRGTTATASSEARLEQLQVTQLVPLSQSRMLSIPLADGSLEAVSLWVATDAPASLEWRLFERDPHGFWIPGDELARGTADIPTSPDGAWVRIPVDLTLGRYGYVHFAVGSTDPSVQIGVSHDRPYGPLSWWSHEPVDARPEDRRAELGWRSPHHSYVVSFWSRADHYWGGPPGPAIAFEAEPAQSYGRAKDVLDPWERPTTAGVHGWSSAIAAGRQSGSRFEFDDPEWLELAFPEPIEAEAVEIYFNSDVDRHLANMWFAYPPSFRAMTTIVSDFDVDVSSGGETIPLAEIRGNRRRRVRIPASRSIDGLRISCRSTHGERFASIADIRVSV